MIDPKLCLVCGKRLPPSIVPPGEPGELRPPPSRTHADCVERTPGVLCSGYTALDLRSDAPRWLRVLRLLTNPIRYVLTGEVRW